MSRWYWTRNSSRNDNTASTSWRGINFFCQMGNGGYKRKINFT